jgi:IclR family transcriptional regulator, pca regulon regulatory protein
MGRVLLAGLDPHECAELLDELELVPLAHETITTRAQLEAELERVREQGYAIVDRELESGLRSVAAPIRDRRRRVVAAVNLAVHAPQVSVEEIRRSLLGPLLDTAAAIEHDLGLGASSG